MKFWNILALATLAVGAPVVPGEQALSRELEARFIDLSKLIGDLNKGLKTASGGSNKPPAADTSKLPDATKLAELDIMIDQALARLTGAGDRFNAMLDKLVESVGDRADTLSRAKFGA